MGTDAVGLQTVLTVACISGLGPGLLIPNNPVLRKEAPSRLAATRWLRFRPLWRVLIRSSTTPPNCSCNFGWVP